MKDWEGNMRKQGSNKERKRDKYIERGGEIEREETTRMMWILPR